MRLQNVQPPEPVFRIWNNRFHIEIEAAGIFSLLADDLGALHGEGDPVEKLARAAAHEELEHAELCRAILRNGPQKTQVTVPTVVRPEALGSPTFSRMERALYSCVAACCITETLSTALLSEMYKRADPGIIKTTVHRILSDEIDHSRMGWTELARAARTQDVRWLSPYLSKMVKTALMTDVEPMLSAEEGKLDLSRWGILPPDEAHELMQETLKNVIQPGLALYGLRF